MRYNLFPDKIDATFATSDYEALVFRFLLPESNSEIK